MSDIRKSLLPFLALATSGLERLEPTTSNESLDWYNKLKPEQQQNLKDETFELLTGMSYESLGIMFSHEELVKIAYDKLKIEGFDV